MTCPYHGAARTNMNKLMPIGRHMPELLLPTLLQLWAASRLDREPGRTVAAGRNCEYTEGRKSEPLQVVERFNHFSDLPRCQCSNRRFNGNEINRLDAPVGSFDKSADIWYGTSCKGRDRAANACDLSQQRRRPKTLWLRIGTGPLRVAGSWWHLSRGGRPDGIST
jgi:hypothetical protein